MERIHREDNKPALLKDVVFRMDCGATCLQIGREVSARVFKSEAFLNNGGMQDEKTFTAQHHMGRCVPGETKVAVTIHILAGGSYLDLVPPLGLVKSTIYSVLMKWLAGSWRHCNSHWCPFCTKRSGQCFMSWLSILQRRVVIAFMGHLVHLMVWKCTLQVLGWKTFLTPATSTAKSFYALNVQAIMTNSNDFCGCLQWVNEGLLHDSSAFVNTKLINLLIKHAHK